MLSGVVVQPGAPCYFRARPAEDIAAEQLRAVTGVILEASPSTYILGVAAEAAQVLGGLVLTTDSGASFGVLRLRREQASLTAPARWKPDHALVTLPLGDMLKAFYRADDLPTETSAESAAEARRSVVVNPSAANGGIEAGDAAMLRAFAEMMDRPRAAPEVDGEGTSDSSDGTSESESSACCDA